jgi:hypothetical protein
MAQARPTSSGTHTNISLLDPYLWYLERLNSHFDEARELHLSLTKAKAILKSAQSHLTPRSTHADKQNLCSIYDFRAGRHGINNTITTAALIQRPQIQGAYEGFANLDPANDFFDTLGHCDADVHTRLVVCQDSLQAPAKDERLIETIFFTHLFGVELDLPPAYVHYLSRRRDLEDLPRVRKYQNPTLIDACVQLEMCNGQSDNVALYLGRKSLGTGSPHLGKQTKRR